MLEDYVLTQPPVYSGPPRPAGMPAPRREPKDVKLPPIPRVADFIAAAAEHYKFMPHRPESDLEFKRAYARVALDAGLTEEQAVRIYAFETGGNGTYDVQAGLTHPKKGSKPISPAVGYNQLLSTNTIGLLAANGDEFVKVLKVRAASLDDDARKAMERKLEALERMIAHAKSVPYAWAEHDKMAKFTRAGLRRPCRDLRPRHRSAAADAEAARTRCCSRSATAAASRSARAELELMNFTGDGNGFDMVMMPLEFRDKVPTSNFFQPRGYSRNPIAKRTGTVAVLIASIEAKMDRASQLPGAQELAAAFREAAASKQAQPMTSLTAHFALLKELEQENQDIETTIADLMDEMERVPPEQRSAGEWGPSGTQTKRFIELSERQNEIAAEIKLVSAAIESAKPAADKAN